MSDLDNNRKYISQIVTVKIDRPQGSKHPKHGYIYPVNYGYIENTQSADGEELDAYVLGVNESVDEFTGTCIAILHRLDDNDDKLIVVPDSQSNISDEDIEKGVHFQEQYFKHILIR